MMKTRRGVVKIMTFVTDTLDLHHLTLPFICLTLNHKAIVS